MYVPCPHIFVLFYETVHIHIILMSISEYSMPFSNNLTFETAGQFRQFADS